MEMYIKQKHFFFLIFFALKRLPKTLAGWICSGVTKGRRLCVGKGNEGSQRTHRFSSRCLITEFVERNEQNCDAKG